jgi:Fur family transcriptional regulator, peroxide stress response regulator
MKSLFEDLSIELIDRDIRPSYQRLKILEYLLNNQHHPTVDQIFKDLQREIPTLSKATVYNTLKAFIEAQLVRVINVADNEHRYDIIMKKHGHFKCESCGAIFDFQINIDEFVTDALNHFQINAKDVYFKGICPGCLSNKNKF